MTSLVLKARTYLLLQTLLVLLIVGGWVVCWWAHNPLGFFNPPAFDFASEKKLSKRGDLYLSKPLQLYYHKPDTLILGNSLAAMAFSREHFPVDRKVINAAVHGSKPYTWLRMLHNAWGVNNNLDTVYLVLDMAALDLPVGPLEQHYRERFESRLLYNTEGEYRATSSFTLISDLLELMISPEGYNILTDFMHGDYGLGEGVQGDYTDSEGFHYYVPKQVSVDLRHASRVMRRKRLFDTAFEEVREFEYLQQLISFCYEKNIRLEIILPPYHVSVYQALAKDKKFGKFVQWKQGLFDMNHALHKQQGRQEAPFTIYDFALYSDLTRDQYVLQGRKKPYAHYFYDLNHFNHNVGKAIMQDVNHPESPAHSQQLTLQALEAMEGYLIQQQRLFSRMY